MIFVTVGSQLPFDRLVLAMDAWARARPRGEVFAQIGRGAREPSHIEWVHQLRPAEFRDAMSRATIVVSHVGLGTIMAAMELHKPVVVLAREAGLREARNDHQVHLLERLRELRWVTGARDEAALAEALESVAAAGESRPEVLPSVSPRLVSTLTEFIESSPRRRGRAARGQARGGSEPR